MEGLRKKVGNHQVTGRRSRKGGEEFQAKTTRQNKNGGGGVQQRDHKNLAVQEITCRSLWSCKYWDHETLNGCAKVKQQISSWRLSLPGFLSLYIETIVEHDNDKWQSPVKIPCRCALFFNYNHTWPSKINKTAVNNRSSYSNNEKITWHKNQVVIYIQSIKIDYIPVFG